MHLKDARDKNKLNEFFAEKAKTQPKASHVHFYATLKSMLGVTKDTEKSKRKTSKRASSGG